MQKLVLQSNKVAIGSAQFGMDYGINNPLGQVSSQDVVKIIKRAAEFGVDTIDTAASYGESEKVLSKALKDTFIKFNIISKTPDLNSNNLSFDQAYTKSIQALGVDHLYAFLIHQYQNILDNPLLINEINKFKQTKVGFSLYYPSELEYLLRNNIKVDLVQLPINLYDQRFLPYLEELNNRGIEVHARSVFLQGLFFLSNEKLIGQFESTKKRSLEIKKLAHEQGVPISFICLGFILSNPYISKAVIGIDSLEQLNEHLSNITNYAWDNRLTEYIKSLSCNDEQIILPSNWKNKA